ncbi:MAG: type II toxin-antitoxin system HicB family antitoxin [Ignavibacteriales bacterium]
MTRELEYYLKLPYQIVVRPSEEGGYAVQIPELLWCVSQGETLEEALRMIEDAKVSWLETAIEEGLEIPEPAAMIAEYSGKLNIRMPRTLHRTLAERAHEERVSLNQYIVYQLARGLGHSSPKREQGGSSRRGQKTRS